MECWSDGVLGKGSDARYETRDTGGEMLTSDLRPLTSLARRKENTEAVRKTICIGLIAVVVTQLASASDWPQWRGPNRDGKSAMTGIRKDWSGGLKKLWEVKGLSPDTTTCSSPSIQGNRLVVLGKTAKAKDAPAKGKKSQYRPITVTCFDADKGGEPIWKQEFPSNYGDYGWGLGPTSTPTIDGDRVYVAQRAGGAFRCLSMADGKELWTAPIYNFKDHGYNASPIAWKNLVILPGLRYKKDGKMNSSLIAAIERETGKTVWAIPRDVATPKSASPILGEINGVEQIVYTGDKAAIGLDPRTGKSLWQYESTFNLRAGPAIAGNMVLLPKGSHEGVHGLKVDKGGAKVAWKGFGESKAKYETSLSAAVEVDACFYTFTAAKKNDRGMLGAGRKGYLVCLDAKTGQVKWEEETGNGNLLVVDGKLLCLNYSGDLFLVEPTPKGFKKITEWKGAIRVQDWYFEGKKYDKKGTPHQPVWTGPVVARGKLYLRYHDTLTCYALTE